MLADLTAEEFMGWQQAFAQEPWGELRDDMRAAANTLHQLGAGQDVELMGPHYFQNQERLDEEVARLMAMKAKHDTAEHQAKLKAARKAHMEAKKRGG
jgi:hypothetical protein